MRSRKELLRYFKCRFKSTERISLTERRPAVAAVSAVQKRNASAETRFKNKISCTCMFYRWTKSSCRVSFLICRPIWMPQWFLVQHMPAGFTNSMANRLDEISEITCQRKPRMEKS